MDLRWHIYMVKTSSQTADQENVQSIPVWHFGVITRGLAEQNTHIWQMTFASIPLKASQLCDRTLADNIEAEIKHSPSPTQPVCRTCDGDTNNERKHFECPQLAEYAQKHCPVPTPRDREQSLRYRPPSPIEQAVPMSALRRFSGPSSTWHKSQRIALNGTATRGRPWGSFGGDYLERAMNWPNEVADQALRGWRVRVGNTTQIT